MDNRELWMAATLVELADTSQAGFDETTYSRGLAARLAELLAPAEIAVLLADGTGGLRVAAASAEPARRLASLEADWGDGPATACFRSGRPVPDVLITASTRWPRFAAAARTAGLGGVFTVPLRRHDETIGVVSVLQAGEHPLDQTRADLARMLTEAAAVAILQQRELRRNARLAEQLRRALDSRVLIEQAKGAVAARLGITPEAAFGLLRGYARRHNRLLDEVAAETIGGGLTAAELVTMPPSSRTRRSGSPAQAG